MKAIEKCQVDLSLSHSRFIVGKELVAGFNEHTNIPRNLMLDLWGRINPRADG